MTRHRLYRQWSNLLSAAALLCTSTAHADEDKSVAPGDNFRLLNWGSDAEPVISPDRIRSFIEEIQSKVQPQNPTDVFVAWLSGAERIRSDQIRAKELLIFDAGKILLVQMSGAQHGEFGAIPAMPSMAIYQREVSKRAWSILRPMDQTRGEAVLHLWNYISAWVHSEPLFAPELNVVDLTHARPAELFEILWRASRNYTQSLSLEIRRVRDSDLRELVNLPLGQSKVPPQYLSKLASQIDRISMDAPIRLALPYALKESPLHRNWRRWLKISADDARFVGTNLAIIATCAIILSRIPIVQKGTEHRVQQLKALFKGESRIELNLSE